MSFDIYDGSGNFDGNVGGEFNARIILRVKSAEFKVWNEELGYMTRDEFLARPYTPKGGIIERSGR